MTTLANDLGGVELPPGHVDIRADLVVLTGPPGPVDSPGRPTTTPRPSTSEVAFTLRPFGHDWVHRLSGNKVPMMYAALPAPEADIVAVPPWQDTIRVARNMPDGPWDTVTLGEV